MAKKKLIVESTWLELALDIAQRAHLGQVRRADRAPYITHPVRVHSITKRFRYPRLVQIAAVLHDAIEDAENPAAVEREIARKLPKILPIVKSLTHEKSEDYLSYISGLSGYSLQVKLSDMLHNLLDNPRPRQREKYRSALEAIAMSNGGKPPAIHEDHWGILLKQVGLTPEEVVKNLQEAPTLLRQYIRLFVEVKMLPEAQERFDLRATGQTFADPIFAYIEMIIRQNGNKIADNFSFYLDYEGLEAEIHYENGSVKGDFVTDGIHSDLLAKLDSIGRFDVEIRVTAGDKAFIDADYVWDPTPKTDKQFLEDEDNLGGVELTLVIPKDVTEYANMSSLLERKVRGHLAHEFQHIIQRAIFGRNLHLTSKGSIERHMRDPDEIDARIEEILATCENEIDVCEVGDFRELLVQHVDEYLTRNGVPPDDPRYEKYKREMIDSHLIKYREKFELWG